MIDITKTYRTRCGYPVRIYATDGAGAYPIHGAYYDGDCWILSKWMNNGIRQIGGSTTDAHDCEVTICPLDLIEVKPRIVRELWVNVYESGIGAAYEKKKQADEKAFHGRLACVKLTIDCEHGEGLE